MKKCILILVTFLISFFSISQNAKPPYPVIFVHGWGGSDKAWTRDDGDINKGDWKSLFINNFKWQFGGYLDICLEKSSVNLHEPASDDIETKFTRINNVNGDFYILNFHIKSNGNLYPEYFYKFQNDLSIPINTTTTTLKLDPIFNTGNINDLAIDDVLELEEKYFSTKREFVKILSIDYANKSVTVKRGEYSTEVLDWWSIANLLIDPLGYLPAKNISNLSSQNSIVKGGLALKNAIDKVKNLTGAKKVILVAHSMGGLNCREYIQNSSFDRNNPDVAKLFTIDTPHQGSNTSDLDIYSNIENWLDLDLQSDAVRDLRFSTRGENQISPSSNDNAPYLFGNYVPENTILWSNSGLAPYRQDLNCDGLVNSSPIIGLNKKQWPSEVLMHSVVTYAQTDIGIIYTDEIVMTERQIPPTNIFESNNSFTYHNNYITTLGAWALNEPVVHNASRRVIDKCMHGLDEPNTKEYSYEIQIDQQVGSLKKYNGLITSDPNNITGDTDWYKFKSPVKGKVEINFSLPFDWRVNIYNQQSTYLGSLTPSAQPSMIIDVEKDQIYYIQVLANPWETSWKEPYIIGLTLKSIYILPTLSLGTVTPASGNTSTNFQFSVYFKDTQAPQYVRTIFSSGPQDMTGNGTYSNGVQFTTNKTFSSPGTYTYYFEAKTATNDILRYPASGNLSVTVIQSTAGWEAKVDPLNTNYFPSSVTKGTTVTVNTEVRNMGTLYDYSNIDGVVEMRYSNGDLITSTTFSTGVITKSSSVIKPVTLKVPIDASNGTYNLISIIYPKLDQDPSNNSYTNSFYIGENLGNEQFRNTVGQTTINLISPNSITITSPTNSKTFTLLGINLSTSYAFMRDPASNTDKIYQEQIKIYGSQDRLIQNDAVWADATTGYAALTGYYAILTNTVPRIGATFDNVELNASPGTTVYAYATAPSGYLFSSSNCELYSTSTTSIKSWFGSVSRVSTWSKIKIRFDIPSTAPLGRTTLYFRTPYSSPANVSDMTRITFYINNPAPSITTLNKTNISADDNIIITGANLSTSGTVKFGELVATTSNWTNTSITCRVPSGVVNGVVTVINSSGASNGLAYTVISSTGDPVVVQPIPDQSMPQTYSLDVATLNSVFADPNNDALVYSAVSSSPNVTTSIVNDILTLTTNSIASGVVQITVSAKDLDNVTVQDIFNVTVIAPPAIQLSAGTLISFGNVEIGSNSLPQPYTVSGNNLAANISIVAPTGFEVSTNLSNDYSSSLTLTQSGGTVATIPIYVRFSPTILGQYSGNITHSSTGAIPQNVSVSGTGICSTPATPTASVNVQPTCAVPTGTIVITAPLGAQYEYQLDAGAFQTSATFTGVALGNHTVKARLAASPTCISTASTSMTVNPVPAVPSTPTASVTVQPTCSVPTGTIVITAPLGAQYEYQLDAEAFQAIATFVGVAVGNHTVKARLAASPACISSASTSMTVNPVPAVPATPTASVTVQPTCSVPTGTIVITAPLGAQYEYQLDAGAFQVSATFTGVALGNHTVKARLAASPTCISSASTSMTVNPVPAVPVAPMIGTITQPTCALVTGSVVLNGLPSSGNWTLTRTPGGTVYTGSGTSYTVTGSVPGTYTFTVTNSVGCVSAQSDNVIINILPPNCNTITDIDGNVYHTVSIGNQVWMVENLSTHRYRNGDPIPNITDNGIWAGLTTGAYSNFNNDLSIANTYGSLYNWFAISDTRNIAPTGWHVPTVAEWNALIQTVGGENVAGAKLKEAGTMHWWDPSNSSNEYGFTALPGGLRNWNTGDFLSIGNAGYWYSSNEAYGYALSWGFVSDWVRSFEYSDSKNIGMSVRCIKDSEKSFANAGPDQSVYEGVLVTLNGLASYNTEGTPLTYKWTAPSGITLNSNSVPKPSFTAPDVTSNTDYVFTLVVSDGTTDSSPDQVVITVINTMTLGNTAVYASSAALSNRVAMPVTFSEAGSIQSISIYHNGGTGSVLLGVYSDAAAPATRLGVSASTVVNSAAGWQTVALTSPVPVSSGQTVWLSFVFQTNPGIRYVAGTPARALSTATWSGGMPATFGAATFANFKYSLYCNYTQPPTNLAGRTVQAAQFNGSFQYSLTLSWSAPVSQNPPISYNVYSSETADGTFNSNSTTETSYSIEIPEIGISSLWFYVKAVYSTGESSPTPMINIPVDIPTLTLDNVPTGGYLDGENYCWNCWSIESHWYKFYAPPIASGDNKSYNIKANGGPDLSLYLYKGNMTSLIATDQNSFPYYDAQLGVANSTGEWYYIRVNASLPGGYAIGVKTLFDLPYTNLILDWPYATDYLAAPKAVEYRFKTGIAGIYTIQTQGSLNTSINLYNGTGLIEQDDDDGEGTNALIQRDLAANTEYIVRMTASSNGGYSIVVNAPIMPLVVDEPCYSSSVVYFNETDWYKFHTGAAGIYVIEQLVNSQLSMSLYESDQTTSIANSYIGFGSGQRIESSLNSNTWYYIRLDPADLWRPPVVINYSYCIGVKTLLTLSPTSVSLSYESGSIGSFNISSNTAWNIIDDIPEWLNVSPTTGTNNATITVTAKSSNIDTSPRTAIIKISGNGVSETPVTVTQGPSPTKTLGNTAVYASSAKLNNRAAMPVTFSEAGTIQSISIYHNGGSGGLLLGVYSDASATPSTRLGVSASTTVNAAAGWQEVSLSPVTVTSGQTVWLSFVFQTNPGIRYVAGTPARALSTATWSGGMPATFGAATFANFKYSLYCTYTTGAAPTLTVSPISISLGYGSGSNGSFAITSNTSWSITDDGSWLDVSPVSGTNNGMITVTANSANTGTSPRIATVTIVGTGVTPNKTVTVTQANQPSATKKLGNTDVYASTATWNYRAAMPVTFSEAGSIQSISIYHNGGTGSVLLGVYSNSAAAPSILLGVSASTIVNGAAGWQTVALTSPVPVTSGQTVWLSFVFQTNPGIRYVTGTPARALSTATWSGGMPATFGSATFANFKYSLYCTYAPSGTVTKTLGNTTVYASSASLSNRVAMPVTFSEAGSIQSISIYHNGGSGNVLLGVYSDVATAPTTLLGISASTAVNAAAGWQTVALTSPVSVTSGQTVWLSFVFQTNPGIRYVAGTPARALSTATWSGGMPATFGAATFANFKYSLYCTYTTSGAKIFEIDNPVPALTEAAPSKLAMEVYPNPSNGVVNFKFSVENSDRTSLEVFSVTGKRITLLLDETMEAGAIRITPLTQELPEGIYLYQLRNGKQVVTGKFIRTR